MTRKNDNACHTLYVYTFNHRQRYAKDAWDRDNLDTRYKCFTKTNKAVKVSAKAENQQIVTLLSFFVMQSLDTKILKKIIAITIKLRLNFSMDKY